MESGDSILEKLSYFDLGWIILPNFILTIF